MPKPPPGKKLSLRTTLSRDLHIDRMKMAARLLVKGLSITDTCKKIGMDRKHFYGWMKDPAWNDIYRSTSDMLNARMDEALAQNVTGRMKLGAEAALDFQLKTLADPDAPEAIKVRIADSLMDRDDRMSKKRQLNVKHGHEILNPEILALAAATAQSMLAAQQPREIASTEQTEVLEAEIVGETSV